MLAVSVVVFEHGECGLPPPLSCGDCQECSLQQMTYLALLVLVVAYLFSWASLTLGT